MARLIVRGSNLTWDGTGRSGQALMTLQWLESLRRLGHEVLHHEVLDDSPWIARQFGSILHDWWDPAAVAAVSADGRPLYGLDVARVEEFARDADACISLGATYSPDPEPWLAGIRPRILIEHDPGFTHCWALESGAAEIFGAHDFYFTVGANVGTARSTVPTLGIDWRHTWNPVIPEWWPPVDIDRSDRFTTVASLWGCGYQLFDGRTWGPKAQELEKFIHLPALTGHRFEVAAEAGAEGDEVVARLSDKGWVVRPAECIAGTPGAYRGYVSGSVGEFSCAKGLYVGTRSGWFSDRSACYLAAGRPVVLQETGFGDVLPTGEGLFALAGIDDAVEAIGRIRADYAAHSAAARRLAEDHFSPEHTAGRLLTTAGVT